jgi:hypothetical protein
MALTFATAAVTTLAPRVVRADDDVISLAGLPPELIQALTGSTMSPDVLAALLAASGGATATNPGAHATGSGAAAPTDGSGNGMAVLSGLLDGVNLENPVPAAGAAGAAAAPSSGGGIVEVRHPGDPPATATARRGPERIRSGRSGGLVELHPAADPAPSDGAVVVGESATSAGTTLPPVRIARPHGRRNRPARNRGH